MLVGLVIVISFFEEGNDGSGRRRYADNFRMLTAGDQDLLGNIGIMAMSA
jgi:hypothetical protein